MQCEKRGVVSPVITEVRPYRPGRRMQRLEEARWALTPRFRRSGIFPIKPVQVPGLAGATSKLGCRVKPPTYISQIMVFATGRPRGISLPSQRFGVDDHTLQRCRRVVRLSRRLPASPYRPGDAFPVRIEEQPGSGNVAPGPDGAGGVRAPFHPKSAALSL